MKRRFLKIFFVLALTITLLVGCSKKSKGAVEAKKNIGAKGGVVQASSNLKLDIPKDALSKDEEITIKYISDEKEINEEPSLNFLGCAEFGPSGTTFSQPVDAQIKLTNKTDKNEIAVFCYDEANKSWDYVTTATVKDGNANFKINHFSKYMVLDLSSNMLAKFRTYINDAKVFGYNDSWIMDSYYNYLVNDEHILDYYQEFGGIYYEAIGLSIQGLYYYFGDECDSNALTKNYGDSSTVGNKYSMTTQGEYAEDYSYSEFKKAYKKAVDSHDESQYLSNVLVTVSYQMIKPQIDLTTSKTSVKQNEKTTVNVSCHYANPNNYFCKDLVLPNYKLTLPFELKNFTVDKKELTTDASGKASFTATAKSQGSDTIKVMFYVEGPFGEYSSAFITLACGLSRLKFEGHITQFESYSVEPYKDPEFTVDVNITQKGSFDITVDYDFTGYFDLSGKDLTGEINFTNITVSFKSKNYEYYYYTNDGDRVNSVYNPFKQNGDIEVSEQKNIPIKGSYNSYNKYFKFFYDIDKNESISGGIKIANISCEEYYTIDGHREQGSARAAVYIGFLGVYPILSSANSTKTQTINSDYFKDSTLFYAYQCEFGGRDIHYYRQSEGATQTITIKVDDGK